MTFREQVYGSDGDVEYHTTDGTEYPSFYYSERNAIRDVEDVQSTSSMRGKSVCVYGLFSNERFCDHTVEATNVTVTADGKRIGSLARTSEQSVIPGDSGGGWSWNNTAFGVTHGFSPDNDYFTPVTVAEDNLDVQLLTK